MSTNEKGRFNWFRGQPPKSAEVAASRLRPPAPVEPEPFEEVEDTVTAAVEIPVSRGVPPAPSVTPVAVRQEIPMQQPVAAAQVEEEIPTMSVLSPKIVLRGAEISSDEDFTSYGQILDGKIHVRKLVIPAGAVMTGQIAAHEIRCHGTMEGDIKADSVILYNGASVSGDVKCRTIGVQPGTTLRGARIDAERSEAVDVSATQPGRAPAPLPAPTTGFEGDFRMPPLRVVAGVGSN